MRLFIKVNIPPKIALGNIIVFVNVFVWYVYASSIVKAFVSKSLFTYEEQVVLNTVLFLSTVISVFAGASFLSKIICQKRFFLAWTLIGMFSSFTLIMLENVTTASVAFILCLVGVSFGLGLPTCMANFSAATKEDNRARFGSIVLFLMFLSMFAFGFIMPTHLSLVVLVLAIWRLLGLVGILLLGDFLENIEVKKSPSVFSLFKKRLILLYLIPWVVFSLINYLSWSVAGRIYKEDFIQFSVLVNNMIAGIFAPVAGFLADNIGRKRTLLGGFIIFGIGYAVLGIYPFNIYALYLYTIIDGIAWGVIGVIFWFTIWGDLAHGESSEKYYAIGILPYALSGFLRVTLGPYIADTVSEYAIFSFAAFFLFLAVVPLMYAPETLPEKAIRERELRSYIEKAKRVREKFTRG